MKAKNILLIVFPAGAGVILVDTGICNVYGSFPRRCGGDPGL